MNRKVNELTHKATAGDPVAQHELGSCYEEGNGVVKNYLEAFKWYEMSAKQGNINAVESVIDFYYKGLGVREDPERAYFWSLIYDVLKIEQNYDPDLDGYDFHTSDNFEPGLDTDQVNSIQLEAKQWMEEFYLSSKARKS